MKHSVQAYLARIPIDQLISFLENDLFVDTYEINSIMLQDILDALISRNTVEGGHLSEYIHKIQKKREKTER